MSDLSEAVDAYMFKTTGLRKFCDRCLKTRRWGGRGLVGTIHQIASMTGYRSIEICWMTWLVQYEGNRIRMEKYRDILERI